MDEQKVTVFDLVAKGIEILDGIGYANADEVKRFGNPILQVSDILKTCMEAWKLDMQKQEEIGEPEIELIETGIEGEEINE